MSSDPKKENLNRPQSQWKVSYSRQNSFNSNAINEPKKLPPKRSKMVQ